MTSVLLLLSASGGLDDMCTLDRRLGDPNLVVLAQDRRAQAQEPNSLHEYHVRMALD